MDTAKAFLLTYFMPEKCYNEFMKFNFLHVPCLRIILSKTLGIWIMLGSVMVKVPQILKLLRAKRADGLSLPSTVLEVYAVSGTMATRISHNFPISAWGDVLFTLVQMAAVSFLIQHYRGHTLRGVVFLLVCSCLIPVLVLHLIPILVIRAMQVSSVPAAIAAQLLQSWICYKNGHTGQLSAISVFLLFAGSLAHVLSSLLDTSDLVTTLPYLVLCCSSVPLVAQVLYYWNRGPGLKTKEE